MPRISDLTRSIFSELDKTILNNFSPEELQRIEACAQELNRILSDAKKRELDPADHKVP